MYIYVIYIYTLNVYVYVMADEADVHEPRAHATPHESAPRRSTGMPHLLSSLPRVLTHLRPAAGFDWLFQPLRFALRVLDRLSHLPRKPLQLWDPHKHFTWWPPKDSKL